MNAALVHVGWLAVAMLSTVVNVGAKAPMALDPTHCQAPEADLPLPAGWEPYRKAVRSCPLVQVGAGNSESKAAKVRVLAVFTDAYYRGLPPDAPWEHFPLPLLVDDSGRCVGKLSHLFPADPPEELDLVPGHWRDGVPQEIQLKVRSPAMGGDYHLPTLRLDPKTHLYRPAYAQPATSSDQDKTPVPRACSEL
ncbi:hypothetical protein [Paracidovorax valerianellae]|nr:hypothetical protein [Paracidovorax valerianellae]